MAYQIEGGVFLKDEDGNVINVCTPDVCPSLSVSTTQHLKFFSSDYAGAQTNATILTPSTGKRLGIHAVFTSTDQTDVNTVLQFLTSGIIVYKLYVSKEQSTEAFAMHIKGEIGESLSLTCGASTFIAISYTEQC